MDWKTRLRLAWKALCGGAPESAARTFPENWTRPPETTTGWDGMIDDSVILYQQLRIAKRRADDAEDDIDMFVEYLHSRAEEIDMIAHIDVDDDRAASQLKRIAEDLEEYAEMLRRSNQRREQTYRE